MTIPRNHRLIYTSSPDRGLDILLYLWPDIRQAYPDATLDVYYGFDLFLKVASGNPERMAWYKSVMTLLKQPGITHHGRVGKEELLEAEKNAGILAFPTYFQEIFCINAVEAQSVGVVPVCIDLAALHETAKEGILVKGDIRDVKVQQEYLKQLLDLMGDKERWQKLSNKCKKFTNKYHWNTISDKWVEYFDEPIENPTVSVVTVTIREGFWNIMAENLSKQTYKPLEWIVVDDYPQDRSKIAEKYAKKYNLTIHYLRGSHGSNYSRRCGLVRANNLGWQNAKGEFIVWLQDFILIPENGIEQLVDVYRHNPDALIAPTDIRYNSTEPDMTNKEDWWNGEVNVLLKEDWRNIRNKYLGIRESDNPYDFETNYAAMPKKILDELNGFWEFFDDGLGGDNLEICYRAMKLGYRLLVDDTNVCRAINIWPFVGGTDQNVKNRERILNLPRWNWLFKQVDKGNLPIIRDENIDKKIDLEFTVPEDVKDADGARWINENSDKIVENWKDYDK